MSPLPTWYRPWCGNTRDQWYAQQRLIELGVTIITGFFVSGFDGGSGTRTLQKIGDCDVPGAVVHATYAGHRLAREFDANVAPMRFERTRLDN